MAKPEYFLRLLSTTSSKVRLVWLLRQEADGKTRGILSGTLMVEEAEALAGALEGALMRVEREEVPS